MEPMEPEKNLPSVHILGGGCGAMAAAFELTSAKDWKDKYKEVVVYQMGWRLGGKGAAGRHPLNEWGRRIEEHGLHIWAGMYHHSFRTMKACYEEWQECGEHTRPFEKAFAKHSHVTIMDPVGKGWHTCPVEFPENDLEPGEGDAIPTIWEFVGMLTSWIEAFSFWNEFSIGDPNDIPSPFEAGLPTWVAKIVAESDPTPPPGRGIPGRWEKRGYGGWMGTLGGLPRNPPPPPDRPPPFYNAPWTHWITFARSVYQWLPEDPREHRSVEHHALTYLIEGFATNLVTNLEEFFFGSPPAHRLSVLVDLASAMAWGTIWDGVWLKGWDSIDDQDLAEWLDDRGARKESLESGYMRAAYEYVFAFEQGDPAAPSQGAGTAMRGLMRLLFAYKGAIFWKMLGSMSQVVFVPFYEVLKKRGVTFKFFHRVNALRLSADGTRIETIEIGRQATPKNDYPYLTDSIKGHKDWHPSPVVNKLEESAQINSPLINFESAWSIWKDVEDLKVTVEPEDKVVLGISLGDFKRISADLISTHPAWADMTEKIKTVRTCALQLWFTKSTADLGWQYPDTLMSGYERPFATWADFTHLFDYEDWQTDPPKSLGYLVGVMRDDDPPDDMGNPQTPFLARERVADMALQWLQKHPTRLWPLAADANDNDAIDFACLHDPEGRAAAGRFNAQYWRANIEPSDRYVQYVPGSSKYRLPADDPTVSNLYLAGDWVRSGLNAGCVECAVMAGIQAARAIAGQYQPIAGSDDLFP